MLVSSLNANAARHQQRAELMQEAMRYLDVSGPVQSRVQVFYHWIDCGLKHGLHDAARKRSVCAGLL